MSDIHSSAVVLDCHNDFLLLLANERAAGNTDSLGRRFLPQLRQGGVDVQVCPIYVADEFLPEAALRRTLLLIEHLKEEVEANDHDVALCRTGEAIDAALVKGQVALVLALEGSHAVGANVELLTTFFRLGVRMASFTWMGNTALAGGSRDGDPGSGLTPTGVSALSVLESLGIVMDISHLSVRSTADVLELATRPLVASHSSARALRDHHRNLPDEHLKGIAATGGVIGVTTVGFFTQEDDPTIEHVVDHIVHVAETVGIDHVGIGSDFTKEWVEEQFASYPDVKFEGRDLRECATISGLETPADFPALTQALEQRGLDVEDIRKILGENFLRVFREVMGKGASA